MIRSRWFWAMNSRGSPWRPAGSRGEAAVSGAASAAFLALFALATPRPYPSRSAPKSAQARVTHLRLPSVKRLDQQLILGRAGAEVGHHRHVDELGEKFLVALDCPVANLAHDRPVDRSGHHL